MDDLCKALRISQNNLLLLMQQKQSVSKFTLMIFKRNAYNKCKKQALLLNESTFSFWNYVSTF